MSEFRQELTTQLEIDQADEIERLKRSIHGKGGWEEERNHYFAEIERLKAELDDKNYLLLNTRDELEMAKGEIERLRTVAEAVIEDAEQDSLRSPFTGDFDTVHHDVIDALRKALEGNDE